MDGFSECCRGRQHYCGVAFCKLGHHGNVCTQEIGLQRLQCVHPVVVLTRFPLSLVFRPGGRGYQVRDRLGLHGDGVQVRVRCVYITTPTREKHQGKLSLFFQFRHYLGEHTAVSRDQFPERYLGRRHCCGVEFAKRHGSTQKGRPCSKLHQHVPYRPVLVNASVN